jgi:hypothetical protein
MPDTISTDFADVVLAATPDTVILRGWQYAVPEPIDCVVHVTRDLYFSAVTAWLDQKAIYFATYQAFCGVGTIDFERLTPRPGHVRLRTAEGVKSVLAYDAAAFTINMERG